MVYALWVAPIKKTDFILSKSRSSTEFVFCIGLIDLVCTTLPEENIDGCATAVFTWWPEMATLFEHEGTTAAICVGIGACKKTNPLTRAVSKCYNVSNWSSLNLSNYITFRNFHFVVNPRWRDPQYIAI